MTTKEQAQQNLKDFKKVADELGIEFCLMDGTCLGAYREGDFLVGDEDDTDLGILSKDYRGDELLEGLKKAGFDHIKQLMIDGKRYGCKVKRGDNHIDILRINTDDVKSYNLGRYKDGYVAYTYPIISEFVEIDFNNDKYNIPANTEKFLERRYADWKTPVSRENFDLYSPDHIPGIIEWKV